MRTLCLKGWYLLWVAVIGLGASGLMAQTYPTKPIRIVTSPVGGGGDFAARLVASGISGPLRQQVIVDNRGAGFIPGQVVSQSPPDGYTLLVHGPTFWISALLRSTPYDPVKDFLPISMLIEQPNVLVVHPSLPVKSVKELIALARANPGVLNVAVSAVASASHLQAEMFKALARVNVVPVFYKDPNVANADLISGEVQMTLDTGNTVDPHIRSGRLRALAVTTTRPSPLYPGLPTVGEAVPGYEWEQMTGMFAPAKTPESIIRQLNQEIVRYLNQAEPKQKSLKSGVEAVGSSPEQLLAAVQADIARVSKVIKEANIKID